MAKVSRKSRITVPFILYRMKWFCAVKGLANFVVTFIAAGSARQTLTVAGIITSGVFIILLSIFGFLTATYPSVPALSIYLVASMMLITVTTGVMISNSILLSFRCELKQSSYMDCDWTQSFNFSQPLSDQVDVSYPGCLRASYLDGDCSISELDNTSCEALGVDVCDHLYFDFAVFVLHEVVIFVTGCVPTMLSFLAIIRMDYSEGLVAKDLHVLDDASTDTSARDLLSSSRDPYTPAGVQFSVRSHSALVSAETTLEVDAASEAVSSVASIGSASMLSTMSQCPSLSWHARDGAPPGVPGIASSRPDPTLDGPFSSDPPADSCLGAAVPTLPPSPSNPLRATGLCSLAAAQHPSSLSSPPLSPRSSATTTTVGGPQLSPSLSPPLSSASFLHNSKSALESTVDS
eukprot:Rmarinus@m.16836